MAVHLIHCRIKTFQTNRGQLEDTPTGEVGGGSQTAQTTTQQTCSDKVTDNDTMGTHRDPWRLEQGWHDWGAGGERVTLDLQRLLVLS